MTKKIVTYFLKKWSILSFPKRCNVCFGKNIELHYNCRRTIEVFVKWRNWVKFIFKKYYLIEILMILSIYSKLIFDAPPHIKVPYLGESFIKELQSCFKVFSWAYFLSFCRIPIHEFIVCYFSLLISRQPSVPKNFA